MNSHQAAEKALATLKARHSIRELVTDHRNLMQAKLDDARDELLPKPEKKDATPDDVLQSHLPECEDLYAIALAASQTLAAEETVLNTQQAYVDALKSFNDAAWTEYWDCESQ